VKEDSKLHSILTKFRSLKPKHLDIDEKLIQDPLFEKSIDEFRKINNYKIPRDKMICISNCCEYLFEIIESHKIIASADVFLPILIYLVLQSNVTHLHSNIK
jgi:Rab5 GDP/GTP exchange factor